MSRGAIPFIRCTFRIHDNEVLHQWANGTYDTAWMVSAAALAKVNHPVFISLSLGQEEGVSGILFRKVWERIHGIFENAGATQFVWVWNVEDATVLPEVYPGKRFVDWLMVNMSGPDVLQEKTTIDRPLNAIDPSNAAVTSLPAIPFFHRILQKPPALQDGVFVLFQWLYSTRQS